MIYIFEDITEELAKRVIGELDSLSGQKEITIEISTYGGCSKSMLAIGSKIEELKNNGIKFKCIARGVVCSAGFYILALTDNITTNDSLFMVHKCHGDEVGNINQIRNSLILKDYIDKKYRTVIRRYMNEDQLKAFDDGLDVYFKI